MARHPSIEPDEEEEDFELQDAARSMTSPWRGEYPKMVPPQQSPGPGGMIQQMIPQVLQAVMQQVQRNPGMLQTVVQQAVQNPGMLMQLASLVPGLIDRGQPVTAPAVTRLGGYDDPSWSDERIGNELRYEKKLDRELADPRSRLSEPQPQRFPLTPALMRMLEEGREKYPDVHKYDPNRERELEPDDPPDLTMITPEMAQQFAQAGIGPQQFMQLASRMVPNVNAGEMMKDVYTDMVDPRQNVEPQTGLPGTSSVNPAASTVFESYRDQGAMQDLMRKMMTPKDPDDPDEEPEEDEEDSEEPTS